MPRIQYPPSSYGIVEDGRHEIKRGMAFLLPIVEDGPYQFDRDISF
jgi:hypothetical protein